MSSRLRLIDLLMICGVLGFVAGIIIPPIVHDGSKPRRVQCMNNLRRIGLALNQYERIHGVYPPSADLARGYSCFLYLMPELENQDIFNDYNLSLNNWSTTDNGSGRSNEQIGDVQLGFLRCPDHRFAGSTLGREVVRLDGTRYPDSARFARTNYAVNWGGGRQGWGRDFEQLCGVSRGPMNSTGKLSIRDVIDGASTTILTSEKKESFGWNVGGWAGSEFDVGTQPGDEGNEPIASKVYTGSDHDGIVNVGLVDGSVRPLRKHLDRRVWYALITRNGREVIDLDELIDP